MKLFHPCAVFKLVLTGEYFLVRKATVFDWQERTVAVSYTHLIVKGSVAQKESATTEAIVFSALKQVGNELTIQY